MNSFSQEKLRILILDDAPVVRRGVRQILFDEGFDPLEFGEGNTGPEGLDLALSQLWDLIVTIDLPNRGGKVLPELKRMRPDQPILVLTIRGTEGQVKVASNPADLVPTVDRIPLPASNGPPAIAEDAVPEQRGRASHENLSNREREVLRLLGAGRTVKEIAAALALSEKTISTYRSRILTKVGLKTTADLIRYALQ